MEKSLRDQFSNVKSHSWAKFQAFIPIFRETVGKVTWRPAIGGLQLSVATSLFFCGCGDALYKANRRFKPYSRLLLPALFSFLLLFFCTNRPLGWPGGTYDTCPATTYNVPLHLVLFMHYADERLLPGALATPASLPSGKWGVLQPQTDRVKIPATGKIF